MKKDTSPQISIFSPSVQKFKQILDELIEVYSRGYEGLQDYAYRRRRDIKSYLKWLYKTDPEVFLIARVGNKAVGFVAGCRYWQDRVYGEVGEIHELVVDKPFQNQGIGRTLTEKILLLLKQSHQIIGLWVGERNERAIKFYKNAGFYPIGQVGKWLRMIKEI